MSKIDDARRILSDLGMPPAQQNDMACLTLLALCGLSEKDSWRNASKPFLTIHQILGVMRESFGRDYAENTRETVRRNVIHQFEQARLADRNPGAPDLPTNSPRTHYGLTDEALQVLKSYRSRRWKGELSTFLSRHTALLEIYQRRRRMRQIPIRTSSGEEIRLSPGKHNRLQALVVTDFGPRFAPGSVLLYMGDSASKLLHVERPSLDSLGISITEHDKLPDVVLYAKAKDRLFLIEAVTSHGPMSPKRVEELEALLQKCRAKHQIFVSAFLDLHEFRKHIYNIAWETEVWVAEAPDHLIHFNGDKLLGRS